MRQWKKLLGSVSLGVCTFAMAAIFSVTGANAAEVAPANLAVDYDAQQLTVKPATADKEIYVAFPTVKDVKTKDKTTGEVTVTTKVTVKTWDIYDGTATVDLSNLNPLKENYVMVKGTASEPVMLHFTPSTTGMKLTYNGANDVVTFTDKKKVELTDKKFQYRTAYGSWKDYTAGTTKLAKHAQMGTTVYFREKADAAITTFAKATKKTIDGYTTYEASHFAGAEAKVKITKLANGPKVTVDYTKRKLTIPLGTEYRFNYAAAWTPVATETNAKGKVVALPVELGTNGTKAGMFEARVAKIDTDKKKAAPSKYTQVAFDAVRTATLKTALTDKTGPTANVGTAVVTDSSKKVNEVTFEYVQNAKTGKYTGVKATNVSANIYEVVLSDEYVKLADVATLDSLKVVATVNAQNAKGVAGAATLALPKYEGKYVYLRLKANAKTKEWASSYICAGKIITPVVE